MSIRVALGQYDTGWHDPKTSLSRAQKLIRDARAAGADLVVLPEMCSTGFTMSVKDNTERLDGRSVKRLSALAAESSVHLIAGVATREGSGKQEKYFNSSFLFAPDGALVAEYRKQKLFAYAREHETYTPGDQSVIVTIGDVRIALLICFELRFPELFRPLAPFVDAFVVIANWPERRHMHWQTLLQARAIENQAYIVGVNRIGIGDGFPYLGGSVIHDPWGDTVASASEDGPALGSLDPAVVSAAREKFPFIPDRRGESSVSALT